MTCRELSRRPFRRCCPTRTRCCSSSRVAQWPRRSVSSLAAALTACTQTRIQSAIDASSVKASGGLSRAMPRAGAAASKTISSPVATVHAAPRARSATPPRPSRPSACDRAFGASPTRRPTFASASTVTTPRRRRARAKTKSAHRCACRLPTISTARCARCARAAASTMMTLRVAKNAPRLASGSHSSLLSSEPSSA